MIRRPIKSLLIFSVFVLCFVGTIFCQNRTADIKYQLAQSYERSGDYESAAKLYEDIFAKDSTNMIVFDALRRSYTQLKRYDDGVALMNRMLRIHPNDIGILSELGSMYVLKSDLKTANAVWARAISIDPKQEGTYRMIAGAMVQSRLFDTAISVYRRARTVLRDQNLFGFDIAYLYSITLNYADATKEYVNLLQQNPAQIGLIQSQIASYTGRTDALNAAIAVVEDATKSSPDNLPYHQLLSWLYMEGKHYDRAYTVYKYLDAKTHAGGHELYNFAVRALKEQAFAAATGAFRDVITLYPNIDIAGPVKFGYAQTLEGTEDESDTLKLFGDANPFPAPPTSGSKRRYDDAIAAYNAVIKEFPTTEVAARSLLRIAIIQQEKLFDFDGARASLETIVKTYRQYPQLVTDGTLRLGSVSIALNDLAMAQTQFQSVTGTGQPITVEQQHAVFHLAELDYFQLHFNDALTKLKALTANPTSDAANDAIALQIFIQENRQPNDSALSAFTSAELLRRQRKFSDALDRLQHVVQQFPTTGIIDDAFIMTGDIQTQLGRYNEAIATYDSLIKKFPESISIDRTLMKMAQVYHRGLNNSAKAIELYQKLLEKYPNSIYANEARKRTRILRGDTI